MDDPYKLSRFVEAQDAVYDQVCVELEDGYKATHWMWFIFPQIKGLGHSYMANRYAISSLEEARAYLQHPVLGSRLIQCTKLVNNTKERAVEQIFGYIDSLKFRSSMTLFSHATSDNQVFEEALQKYFGGEYDSLTLELL